MRVKNIFILFFAIINSSCILKEASLGSGSSPKEDVSCYDELKTGEVYDMENEENYYLDIVFDVLCKKDSACLGRCSSSCEENYIGEGCLVCLRNEYYLEYIDCITN